VVTCSPVYSRAETGSASRDQIDDSIDVMAEGSTVGCGPADGSSPPSLIIQQAADAETTAKVASPSANDACCDVGSENLTTQIQSAAETLPMAIDDSGTRSTADGLWIGAVLGDGQAQAHGQCPYHDVSS
jgi:hypothetical protein